MMMTKAVPDHTLKLKTLVLKVFIHCHGCQKKVLKILRGVEGVYATVVDNNKVTVTGEVDADTLIKTLARAGKHAEVISSEKLPEKKEKSNKQSIRKHGAGEIKSETTDGEENLKIASDGVPKQRKKKKKKRKSGREVGDRSGDGGNDNVGETTVVGSPVSNLPPLDPIAYPGSYGTGPYVVGGANDHEDERSGCLIM